MCRYTCRQGVLHASSSSDLYRGSVSKQMKNGGRPILFDPPSCCNFKSLVDNCQDCIILGKWFQTYIHFFFFLIEIVSNGSELDSDVILESIQCDS